jgi:hypothetical protein
MQQPSDTLPMGVKKTPSSAERGVSGCSGHGRSPFSAEALIGPTTLGLAGLARQGSEF